MAVLLVGAMALHLQMQALFLALLLIRALEEKRGLSLFTDIKLTSSFRFLGKAFYPSFSCMGKPKNL